jgi:hypothetical protein
MQDTQTPSVLDTIYEQITRSASGYNVFVESGDLSYEHNEAQQLNTQFVASQSALLHQLNISHAREKKTQADLLAAEQEHEKLKSLIPALREADKKRRGWEVIADNARARCAEAEKSVFKLRADLTAATDCVRHVQEQLDGQMVLALDKDDVIQSITEESQVARVKLKNAEDKAARLDAKLRRRHDRRLRETKLLFEEQVKVQDLHESELRRLSKEAKDAREQLDRQAVLALDKDHTIQSLTKDSEAGHARLKYAEDEVERQNAELRRERDRRLREAKRLSDEQARVQERHESEVRCLTQVARSAQEELDCQTALASDKDLIIQSITEDSQAAHVRLKSAEDEVERLNAELRREHDRRLLETKQLLDEQVGVQDRHESEMRRLAQDAQKVREELDHQMELASDKDQIIQLLAAESQAAHVKLKYLEGEVEHLNGKLRLEHDRRLRETKRLLDEQVRVLDGHESEVCRLTREVRNAQEQLDHQAVLASDIDRIVQSITEESEAAHGKLKYAEDKVEHLDAELRREHDRRLCETKELLYEQARVQDRHEAEIRRLSQVAQDAQEQLDCQMALALDKDLVIQSIAKGSQAAHGKLKYAEDKVEHLSAELRRERDRRLRETKELSEEQAREQDLHEAEMRRLAQEAARDARDQLGRPRPPPPTTWPCDDSELSLTPERIPNAGAAQDQRVALEELSEWVRQPEFEGAQEAVKPNSELDESLMSVELAVAEEQWRLPRLLNSYLPPSSESWSSSLYLDHQGCSTTPPIYSSDGNAKGESIGEPLHA